MSDQSLRIVYMGSAAFACAPLEAIAKQFTICAVYSCPDRPAGRGLATTAPPVATAARALQLPLFQPESLRSSTIQAQLRDHQADVWVVCAYGHILPQDALNIPRFGAINIHPSLLPRWRGAAPIQRCMIAGDQHTGVCIMQMDAGCDTGPIIHQHSIALPDEQTYQALEQQLNVISCTAIVDTLQQLQQNQSLPAIKQSEHNACYADKITAADRTLDWHRPARLLTRQIHALSPKPGCVIRCKEGVFKLRQVRLASAITDTAPPGSYNPEYQAIATGDGWIQPVVVQKPGKNAIDWQVLQKTAPWTAQIIS